MKNRKDYHKNLERDLLWVFVSILLAFFLLRMGALKSFLNVTQELKILNSFIAGLFFTSVFTIAPASIALAEMAKTIHPYSLALWGALGAMCGDLIIFYCIRDVFAQDVMGSIKTSRFKKTLSQLHFGFLRWIGPLVGALIVISPLPDELGLTLLGISKIRTMYLIPLAFALNFISILGLAYVVQNI